MEMEVLERLTDVAGHVHVENVHVGFRYTVPQFHIHLCEILSPLQRPHCLHLFACPADAACGVPEAEDARAPPTSL